MDFRVLGPFEVEADAGPVELRGNKRRGLMAYLVVHRGRLCRADEIIEGLWHGEPTRAAAGTVQTYVSQLRKMLNDDVRIVTRAGGYVLDAPAESVDAERFDSLLKRAISENEPALRLETLRHALSLHRGRALDEFAGAPWADEPARSWERLHVVAIERFCDTLLDLGEDLELEATLEAAVASYPLQERFWAQLATARYRAGDPSRALAACRDGRRALAEALGMDPGPELVELERRILDHDVTTGTASPPIERSRTARMAPSGVVTFLITDIERSAQLWESDPESMSAALARHDEIIDSTVVRAGGRVFTHAGDGLFVAFGSPSEAVKAAVDCQRALLRERWPTQEPVRVRMALHTGEAVVERDGDYFGPVLNRCARVLALARGTQILVTGTVADSVRDRPIAGVTIDSIGEHRLRDLAQPERIGQVAHAALPRHEVPLRASDAEGNLPAQLTRFIGRENERAEVAACIAEQPLTTLVGPGGIGKTRLALFIATQHADDFTGGAWFVDLASLRDGDLAAAHLAAVLGVDASTETLTDAITHHLAGRDVLVVLDNCEHVIDGIAILTEALLRDLPRLRILATSRQPLEVEGEVVIRVGPLPHDAHAATEDNPSIGLFVDRAQATSPFRLDDQNTSVIAELCARLEGIPLALELAAARVRSLQPADLLARLDDRFRLLRGSRRAHSARHQTLYAALEWSYDLLADEERALFERLSVFRGGFGLEAAEFIGADTAGDTLELIDRLVNRSFVVMEARSAPTRYRLLETLREYGADRLACSNRHDEIKSRHAQYFLARPYIGPEDDDNLRAAIDWEVLHAPVVAANAVIQRWSEFTSARLMEAQRWLEEVVGRVGADDSAIEARVLERLGDACFRTGEHMEEGVAGLERAIEIREARGETLRAARAHVRLARNLSGYPQVMDIDRAMEHATAAEGVLRELDQESMLAEVHLMKASTALYGRRNEEGIRAAQQAALLAERHDVEVVRLHALSQLGVHLGYRGDVEEGFALLEHAWETASIEQDHFAEFLAAWMRGFGALLLCDPPDALFWLERERLRAEAEEAPLQARTLDSMLALAHLRMGDAAPAQRMAPSEVLNAPQLVPYTAIVTGDWHGAICLLTERAAESQRRGNRNEWTQLSVALAQTHGRLGDVESACEIAERVLDTLVEDPSPYYELPTRALLASLGVDAGRHLAACGEITAAHDYRGLVGAVQYAAAEDARRQEEFDAAMNAYRAAIATFRRYQLRLDIAEALAAWSNALRDAGDQTASDERASQCALLLEELGAPAWNHLLLGGAFDGLE